MLFDIAFVKIITQSFRRLSDGLAEIATAADAFKSRSISGLLRAAPDLEPYIDNVESIFENPDKGEFLSSPSRWDLF